MSALFPEGRRFAFTIVNDTDNSTVENVAPIYDLLHRLGLRTTKTTWVYPPRDSFTGQSLADDHYRRFVLDLHDRGFEIALHNVGSGHFTREEILAGLDRYRDILGEYPRIHINHASNPDNLYLGGERFVPPLRWLYRLYWRLKRRRPCRGEDPF